MDFEILYFVDEKKRVPVREYIRSLPIKDKSKVFAYVQHLVNVGYEMRRPFADYLGEGTNLYELRPGRHRILYFFLRRNKIILLHAFLKKTNEVPERDLETALRRKEICEVLHKYDKVDFSG